MNMTSDSFCIAKSRSDTCTDCVPITCTWFSDQCESRYMLVRDGKVDPDVLTKYDHHVIYIESFHYVVSNGLVASECFAHCCNMSAVPSVIVNNDGAVGNC